MQDAARLTRVPGIGKKTAERLLLELKGKIGADLGALAGAASASDHASDILNALIALGYSEKEALAAVKNVPAGTGVSEGIKLALKALVQGLKARAVTVEPRATSKASHTAARRAPWPFGRVSQRAARGTMTA